MIGDLPLLLTEVGLGILFLVSGFIGWFVKMEVNKQREHRKEVFQRLNTLEKQLAVNCKVTSDSNDAITKLSDKILNHLMEKNKPKK